MGSIKILGFSGVVCLSVSGFVLWIDAPLGGSINGYMIPLFDLPSVNSFLSVTITFGIMTFVLGLIGFISLFFKVVLLRVAVGVSALVSGLAALYKMALYHPSWVIQLIDQNNQYQNIIKFTKEYLPGNPGVEPTNLADIEIDSLMERIAAIWHFISWGWYLCLVGGILLILSIMLGELPKKVKVITFLGTVMMPVIYSIIVFTPHVLAEHYQTKGEALMIEGLSSQALSAFQTASNWDPAFAVQSRYLGNLGNVYSRLGRTGSAEYYLYKGDTLKAQDQYEAAAFAYEKATEIGSEAIKRVVSHKQGWLFTRLGLREFGQGQAEAAIAAWQRVLSSDPTQIQAHYFLAKAYFDTRQFRLAILENERFLQESRHSFLNANSYANLGDCSNALKEFVKARFYYRRSMETDPNRNFRALQSLVGS